MQEKLRRRMEAQEAEQSRSATPRNQGQEVMAKRLAALEADLEALREELLAAEEAAAAEQKRASDLEAALELSGQELAEWKALQAVHSKREAKQVGKSRSCTQLALSEELQGLGADAAAGPKAKRACENNK